MTPTIRPETPADHEAVRHVNRLAFGGEDEARLVDALRAGGHARVSLVAEVGGAVVGHVLFSEVPILTDGGTVPALSLAPMAVLPEYQRRGVGSALVREGLRVCQEAGHRIVVVLGHPAFYPRFGFSAGLAERLANPFHGGEAWMALELVPGALGGVTGWVRYPPPFGAGVQVRPVHRPDRGESARPGDPPGEAAGHCAVPPRLRLLGLPGTFAVCKLQTGSPVPPWATAGDLFCVTRTPDELSVVCRQEAVPDGVVCEGGWRCLRVAGAMPFTLVGVLASLTAPLAGAGVGVFAVSTFDTDYLLVKEAEFREAVAALRSAGHAVEPSREPTEDR